MSHASPYRRLWSLAWPLMLTNLTVPLLGLVDTFVLGHLESPVYLAAVAVGANLFTILYWSFGFLRMGTTGLTAQAQGAQNHHDLRRLLVQSLLLGATLGALLLVLHQPLIRRGLTLMKPAPEVMELAMIYCQIRIFSAPAVLAQYALVGWLIGRHDTRAALYLAVVTNLINLTLDLVFVLGFGMTAAGVALATVIAETSALGLGLWLIRQRHPQQWQQAGLGPLIRQWSDYLGLLRVNRFIFVRTVTLLLVFAFFTAQGARLGTDILAANAVLMTFLMLISNGLDGFANGVEVLTGEAVGARRLDRLKDSLRAGLICAVGGAVLFCLLFLTAGPSIIRMLTDLPQTRELAMVYLPWLIAMPLLAVWSYLWDGVFIGATQVRAMQNSMLLSAGVFLLLWWVTRSLGNHGLWLSLCTFMLVRGLSLGWLALYNTRQQRWF